ncbi:MAG: hypothetical protein HYU86_06085 [Chloroflexi bacterium]|nr:hypothetical protein [Chloroflexota bacterium]
MKGHLPGIRLLGAAGVLAMLLAACTSGVSQGEYNALKAKLETAKAAVVVQAGNLQPAPAGAQPTGWDTPESIRGGLHLVSTFDSSGPDAWDAKAHPVVYFSSEGTEDSSPLYDKKTPYFAGFHIVDAQSKQVVKSALFNVGREITRFPHGVDVSPDGKWAYVGWGQKTADGKSTEGVVAIVNVRTLKIDKLLKQESYYQGQMRSQSLHHIQAFKDWQGRDRVILQWGFGSVGGPHFILDPKNDNKVVKAINYDDVRPLGHPFTTPSPDGKFIYVSMDSPEISAAEAPEAAIAKLNLEDGSVKIIPGVGHHPIGIAHTADGKTTYVVDAHGSEVYKIDNTKDEVVGRTSAGVAGPYGLSLNWDETLLYVVGKGEGSHNLGGVLGVIDTKTFRQARDLVHQMPINLGGSASSVDHGILNPDPAVNELWVSNMNGWETIVVDLNTNKPIAWIPTPNGGNTHSGGFVRYSADWTGELLLDMGGPKSQSIWDIKKAKIAKLAAAR